MIEPLRYPSSGECRRVSEEVVGFWTGGVLLQSSGTRSIPSRPRNCWGRASDTGVVASEGAGAGVSSGGSCEKGRVSFASVGAAVME